MKKTIGLLLVISMTLSLFASQISYAASSTTQATDSAALQAVLKTVKGKIDIPQELDRFSYEVSDNFEGRIWYFTWRNEDNSSIRISADNSGRILNLNKYNSEYYTTTAPELTKFEAKEKAKAYLKTIAPEIYGNVSQDIVDYESLNNNTYQFTFNRIENDLPCNNHSATMYIRYDTGELVDYNLNWDFNIKYPAPKKPITEETARNTWGNALEMTLRYNLFYSSDESEKPKAFLAYSPKKSLNAIDAESGEVVEQSFEWTQRNSADMQYEKAQITMAGAGDSYNNGLTETEIKKAAELNGLLTLTAADKKIRSLPNLILDSSYKIASSRLYIQQNYYNRSQTKDDKYIWDITYSGPVTKGDLEPLTIYTQVDAKTGELISYYSYNRLENEISSKRTVNKEKAQTIAGELAKAAVPGKFENSKYIERDEEVIRPLKEGEEEPINYFFTYTRTHKDIELNTNYIDIDVNAITGKVTRFSYSWNDNIEFESLDGIMDEEAARESYLSSGKAILGYSIITAYLYDREKSASDLMLSSVAPAKIIPPMPDSIDKEYRPFLAYNFVSTSEMISAKTGKPINYMGKEIESGNGFDGYTDIKGNRAEREITLLCDAGILPKDNQFKPDDIITQKDYLTFMLRALNSWYQPLDAQEDLDYLYRVAEEMKITEKSERDPNKELNRFETMKYMINALGFGKLSKDASLFNVTFKDANSIPRVYYGAVALSKHFSLTDSSASSFNGAEKVTRAETAAQIYKFMKSVKNKQ